MAERHTELACVCPAAFILYIYFRFKILLPSVVMEVHVLMSDIVHLDDPNEWESVTVVTFVTPLFPHLVVFVHVTCEEERMTSLFISLWSARTTEFSVGSHAIWYSLCFSFASLWHLTPSMKRQRPLFMFASWQHWVSVNSHSLKMCPDRACVEERENSNALLALL